MGFNLYQNNKLPAEVKQEVYSKNYKMVWQSYIDKWVGRWMYRGLKEREGEKGAKRADAAKYFYLVNESIL